MPFWIKFAATVILILTITEVVKKSEQIGALITALPWVALLSLIWLHMEHQPTAKIADYSALTFWYVLPTLPMFLLLPKLLSMGMNFWLAFLCGIASAIACLFLVAPIALKFGMKLM